MEINAMLYFWICSLVSSLFLRLGFDLSHSVSHVMLIPFKFFLVYALCFSSIIAMASHPEQYNSTHTYSAFVCLVSLVYTFCKPIVEWELLVYYTILFFLPLFYYCVFKVSPFPYTPLGAQNPFLTNNGFGSVGKLHDLRLLIRIMSSAHTFRLGTLFGIGISVISTTYKLEFNSHHVITTVAFLLPQYLALAFCIAIPRNECRITSILRETVIDPILRNYKTEVKFVHFAIGLMGMVLFQHYVKLTSWVHVMDFLCIVVSWLAMLALQLATDDFGVFNFLLCNVVVSSMVNDYGLCIATWLSVFAALVLYHLRLVLLNASLVDKGDAHVVQLQLVPNLVLRIFNFLRLAGVGFPSPRQGLPLVVT